MEKTYIRFELGGSERGLKFNMNTYGVVKEITGEDPFKFTAKSESIEDIMGFLEVVVYAAMKSNCISRKEEPDFTQAQVREWIGELSPEDSLMLISFYNGTFKPIASPEGSNGAQPQTSNVGGN